MLPGVGEWGRFLGDQKRGKSMIERAREGTDELIGGRTREQKNQDL